MCNGISILLYQLRISRQLFLKQRKERKLRVGKRSQQVTGCEETSLLPSAYPVPAKEFTPSIQVPAGPLFSLHLPQPLTWLKRCPRIISEMEEVRPVSYKERAGEKAQDIMGRRDPGKVTQLLSCSMPPSLKFTGQSVILVEPNWTHTREPPP